MVGGGIAALAIVAFIVAKAAGVFSGQKVDTPSSGVLVAPPVQTVNAPVLSAPSVSTLPSAPVLQAPAVKGNPMPDDVIEYLRWLKQFEAARHQLESKGDAQLTLLMEDATKDMMTGKSMGLLDGDPNTPTTSKGPDFSSLDSIIQDWNKATGIFQQKTPPNPCATLATDYNGALIAAVSEMSSVVGTFRDALSSIKSANGEKTPQAQDTLTQLFQEKNTKGQSRGIDQSFQGADAALDAVRNQYSSMPDDINKQNFSIKSEGSGFAIPGLPF